MKERSARGLPEQGKHGLPQTLNPKPFLASPGLPLRHRDGVQERQAAPASREAVPQQLLQGSCSKQRQRQRHRALSEKERRERS